MLLVKVGVCFTSMFKGFPGNILCLVTHKQDLLVDAALEAALLPY